MTKYGGKYFMQSYTRDMHQYGHPSQWTMLEEAVMWYADVLGTSWQEENTAYGTKIMHK